jgi:hypothetical protein
MSVKIPKSLLIQAHRCAEKIDIASIEFALKETLIECQGHGATTALIGAASAYVLKARNARSDDEAQEQLWQCYDVISAGWRDSQYRLISTVRPDPHAVKTKHGLSVIQGGRTNNNECRGYARGTRPSDNRPR